MMGVVAIEARQKSGDENGRRLGRKLFWDFKPVDENVERLIDRQKRENGSRHQKTAHGKPILRVSTTALLRLSM